MDIATLSSRLVIAYKACRSKVALPSQGHNRNLSTGVPEFTSSETDHDEKLHNGPTEYIVGRNNIVSRNGGGGNLYRDRPGYRPG